MNFLKIQKIRTPYLFSVTAGVFSASNVARSGNKFSNIDKKPSFDIERCLNYFQNKPLGNFKVNLKIDIKMKLE